MDELCHVCGQLLDDDYPVNCISCGKRVHFRSTDEPGDDCARIVTQMSLCGLAFICNPCYDRASAID